MTDAEQREAARQFINRWQGKGNEDEDGRSYWIELLHDVLGMEDVTKHVEFEKKVYVDGNKKRIDAYLPETQVIIEQKSLGKALDQKIHNSGDIDLTPYEQAKRYSDNLDFSERARWIVTCNFAEIWIYDMNQVNTKDFEPTKIHLPELQDKYPMLDFLIKQDVKQVSPEMKVSIEAGNIVGKLYDAFLEQYQDPTDEHSLKSLNALCVRLVFCFYAEDAGIFGKRDMFHDYLETFDAAHTRNALIRLFRVLDQKLEDRDPYLEDDLAQFPYVNGGLFSDENIEIPTITDEIRELILKQGSKDFNWAAIDPTIFGAVFESTLNPETRRKGGMHYTSIENIHKVIDPLFLDDLKVKLDDVLKTKGNKNRENALKNYQKKLASLTFLDPACGSGNFLTETYLSLRKLENRIIQELIAIDSGVFGQIKMGESMVNPIKVLINQFYGIEINDFAVTVAKTALWIAESQMMQETESIIKTELDFLPLTTNANVVEGNALQIDWNDVVPANQLNYIMGNPPFVGARFKSKDQNKDVERVFKSKSIKAIDYVCCWYILAANYIENTSIKCAFVSTNSICQGEQVPILWKRILKNCEINFAYHTFVWNNGTKNSANVFCIIIGFSCVGTNKKEKIIYDGDNETKAKNINGYLFDGKNIFIERRSKPICNVPKITLGNVPKDDGNFILSTDEKDELIKNEPLARKWIHKYLGSREFINNKDRWVLWLTDANPQELKQCPQVLKRIENVRNFRKNSVAKATRQMAAYPTLFWYISQPDTNFLVIPRTSSQRRVYIPIGYLSSDVIVNDAISIVPNANLYVFGIITSNVHNSFIRAFAGRLKSDYRYSGNIVYNNFPWPTPTTKQKKLIERTAQNILEVRNNFPKSSLADLYDPLTMPPELRKAHQMNDRAVMQAYGFSTKMSESDCVAELMKMYQHLTENEKK